MKNTENILYVLLLAIVAAIGGFLFGYDTAVISGTISQITSQFNLSTLQSGWYVGCALIGSIVGVLFAGKLSDSFGRKSTMIFSAALFTISALGCAVSPSLEQLIVYRIVGGLGIGIVSIVSPLYISEIYGNIISACNYNWISWCLFNELLSDGFIYKLHIIL